MPLVQLEGRNGGPIWINPDHVVSLHQNHESNTFVGQPHTACTQIELVRISWIVRGEPEDVIEKLTGIRRRRKVDSVSSAGSD